MFRKGLILWFFCLGCCTPIFASDGISLAGTWRFELDAKNNGIAESWFNRNLVEKIDLPGTTDERFKGEKNTQTEFTSHLSRLYPFEGPAWYQRDVEIPSEWNGKHITLLIERTKPSTVWVDDRWIGQQDSLAGSHVYDLSSELKPGIHRLTIRIDNHKRLPVNGGHQLSNDTQTNWNGLLGRIELRAFDPVWIEELRVDANVQTRKIHVHATLGNTTGVNASGTLELQIQDLDRRPVSSWPVLTRPFDRVSQGTVLDTEYDMGKQSRLWDEFSPVVYQLSIKLSAAVGDQSYVDTRSVEFGLREFTHRGTQFAINGKTLFLRGKHDACVFPFTGYAPMDTESWIRVFQIAKSYGINHYRFHSWCPPEAAFTAADQEGIYLQPELANFGTRFGDTPESVTYNREEGYRILRQFGNHPSFVMFALGNEISGDRKIRGDMVREFRQFDSRRLYAQGSNYDLGVFRFAEGDDYWTTMRTRAGEVGAVRGSVAHCDLPLGHIQNRPPSTSYDYTEAIADVPVPVIGHEIGQYQVFPNFQEIDKYVGVLKPWNLAVFRERLKRKGMSDQADAFFHASGALSVLCYREEIEAALRTKGFGGFQLLDLQDFPGQGTALVGILDAFMDSKGLIKPETWRQFCSETVPLVVMPKYSWMDVETFNATVKIAHYGPSELSNAIVAWSLVEPNSDRLLSAGKLPVPRIPQGTLQEAGTIQASLTEAYSPCKLILKLEIEGSPYRNQYDLWVFPEKAENRPPSGVTLRRSWDDATREILTKGGKVILIPELPSLSNSIEGFFASDFWCYPMFRSICEKANAPIAPGTLGILCDPTHPALQHFPTESHSDWQWWPLLMNSRFLILDETPADYRPIVQGIDNFDRNHKLGNLFECKVESGRLLICTMDLLGHPEYPEIRQMLASLLAYAESDRFEPKTSFTAELVGKLLRSGTPSNP